MIDGYQTAAAATRDDEPQFLVGQDEQGRWLALGAHNRCGGLFATRAAALHYADGETGHRVGAIALATRPLRLPF